MKDFLAFLNQNSGALTVIFTAVVTIATAVYAFLTWILVSETRKMREVQTEPRVQITLDSLDIAIHLVRLKIKNIGQGPALNLKFSFASLSETQGAKDLLSDFTESNFFSTGFGYFGPNEERISNYTEMTKGHDEKIEAKLEFALSYCSLTGKKYVEKVLIDMSEYKGTYRLGTPHMYSIASSLEKIQQDIQRIGSGWNKLKVYTFNAADRQHEREEHLRQIEEFKKRQQDKPHDT